MTAYIGVVGPETIPVKAQLSILNIKRREGDGSPRFLMGTKGYELRQTHINNFISSEHDELLLLDHDMIFAEDTLERLRSHGLPYVSGYYMRRSFPPMCSVWFDPYPGTTPQFPMMPYFDIPLRGQLAEIGASGWGCIYIKREVIDATRPYLNGEWEVLEDDCAVWADTGEPLRFVGQPIGSDMRYPIYAKRAGYPLYGDPDVRPSHIIDYPLSPDDFENQLPANREQWRDMLRGEVLKMREAVK